MRCKPRMWAQYAEKHTGLCLVFNKASLTSAIQKQLGSVKRLFSGRVEYIDRSILRNLDEDQQYVINIDALEDLGIDRFTELHLEKNYHRFFFEKMTDWRDECEWRWVAVASSDQDLYVAFGTALVGIMFGEDTPDEGVREVMNQTEGLGLRYMGLRWKNCSPWYDYGNLRYVPGIKNSPWARDL